MHTIINAYPFRIFPDHAAAAAVAAAAAEEDPADTYRVLEHERGYVVAVYDEEGFFLGNHP